MKMIPMWQKTDLVMVCYHILLCLNLIQLFLSLMDKSHNHLRIFLVLVCLLLILNHSMFLNMHKLLVAVNHSNLFLVYIRHMMRSLNRRYFREHDETEIDGFNIVVGLIPRGLVLGFKVVGSTTGADGVDVVGSDVVGIDVVGIDVVGLDVVGLDVVGLDVVGLDVVGLYVVGLDVVGLDVVGSDVGGDDGGMVMGASVGSDVGFEVGSTQHIT